MYNIIRTRNINKQKQVATWEQPQKEKEKEKKGKENNILLKGIINYYRSWASLTTVIKVK